MEEKIKELERKVEGLEKIMHLNNGMIDKLITKCNLLEELIKLIDEKHSN